MIPEVLPDERQYTRALSLSRFAYDLESLVSPLLAAALLTVLTYNNLFVGTVIGFLASTLLVLVTVFPAMVPVPPSRFFERLTQGTKVFRRSRELRALLAMNLTVAASTAWVIVNTVVLVKVNSAAPKLMSRYYWAHTAAGPWWLPLRCPRCWIRLRIAR